jgi:predicted nucleotide-binding protein (sugar kinase/HSP70/actin superfamily)
MYEILKIKAQLEIMRYTDTDSLFELRMALMNAGTLLTSRHLANQRVDRNPVVSDLLMRVFRNVREYYHVLETTKDLHELIFDNIRELIIKDLLGLYKELRKQKTKIFSLPQEQSFPLSLAR